MLPDETREALLAASALSQPTMTLVAAATNTDPKRASRPPSPRT